MVLLPIELHVTLCGLQATHKPTLLLPQSCHHRQTSTGAAMEFKPKTVTKVLLPIEVYVTLLMLQATHKSTLLPPQSSHHQPTSTGAAMVLKQKTVTRILLPIEIHVTLCGLQATYKSTLLLPQSFLVVVSLLGSVWNKGTSPADLHLCNKYSK